MMTGSKRSGRGERGWIVRTPEPGMLKVTRFVPGLALATWMALRREPRPESLVLVTTRESSSRMVPVAVARAMMTLSVGK